MLLNSWTEGAGPRTVALVHGLGGTADTWRPLARRIAADGEHTVVAVDLAGHGASPRRDDGTYTVAGFADDVVETLAAVLGAPPDVAVGHSLGGAVLAAAAGRLTPGRAVYLDPGFRLPLPARGPGAALFWRFPTLGFVGVMLRQRLAGTAPGPLRRTPEGHELADAAKKRWDSSMQFDVFHDLALHPVPPAPPVVPSTVVLTDDAESVVPRALADALAGQGWDVRRVAGLGHDLVAEDPDRTLEAIRDLL